MTWLRFVLVGLLFMPVVARAETGAPATAPGKSEVSKSDTSVRESPMRAAIFVQNRAGLEMDSEVPMFRDQLTALLTNQGFAIMDGHDVIDRLHETKGEPDPMVEVVRAAAKGIDFVKTEASVEQVLNGASALRIAQMLDAQYLIVATLISVGSDLKEFHGKGTLYKSDNQVVTRTLRTSLKVLEGERGATVYGDTVVSRLRVAGNEHLTVVTNDADNELVGEAAITIANNISAKIGRIKAAPVDAVAGAEISVAANIEGATVEFDGATMGSVPGKFVVRPGLHQIAVSKERYVTWRRTVNVVPGQVLNVTLERSGVGEGRNENSLRVAREDELERKTQNAAIDIAKEQSEANAYAKKKVAEGEKEFRSNSYTQIEGSVNELNIGRSDDVVVKVERE